EAERGFLNYLESLFGLDFEPLRFETQVHDGEFGRPDLVGFGEGDRKRLVVEAKFWAGLTGDQPSAYRELLPSDSPGLLLFLRPERRFQSLWPGISSLLALTNETMTSSFCKGRDGDNIVGAISWEGLLDRLAAAVEGQRAAVSDVAQLRGLRERME